MTEQSDFTPPADPALEQIAATERMTKGFLFSYRANAIMLNTATFTVLPFIDWGKLVLNNNSILAWEAMRHVYNIAVNPIGSGINLAITAGCRRSMNELKDTQNQLLGPPAQYVPQKTRDGTKLMADYIVDKIQTSQPRHKWNRATQISAVTHAMRQNILGQTLAYKALIWATVADGIGYGVQAVNQAFGGRRYWRNKFVWRNTCKALLTDLGMIAPSEDNMKVILENSIIKNSNGRIGYEARRLGMHPRG